MGNNVDDLLGVKKSNSSGLPPLDNKDNPVASMLRTIGIIILIIGVFSALITGFSDDFPDDFKSTVVIFTLVSSAIQCAIFYGFSEIIYLLTSIKNKN